MHSLHSMNINHTYRPWPIHYSSHQFSFLTTSTCRFFIELVTDLICQYPLLQSRRQYLCHDHGRLWQRPTTKFSLTYSIAVCLPLLSTAPFMGELNRWLRDIEGHPLLTVLPVVLYAINTSNIVTSSLRTIMTPRLSSA
ncbi:hypothetical protein P153DRAFT_229831 [Dothidotthia symphoricarpi CBS 119687]|uniref:Uncharacterized protein n=1 Tax=Dothidotthia symphoricarpi CBS 119687 TaxID=1392245 RepID=A0A6A6AG81_9PLEO|nr:uncharacterized protein P153DRAFT_229831 [Dothidotthia symphoricarpi CBS 119687]KAF2130048.1 hypothetical protein P153DRAFT_229831 [Dothidotthia symphoricarpi CBS 119687]